MLIDARMPPAFASHIPGAYNIWLAGLATWPGWLADYHKPIFLLLDNADDAQTAVRYLYRLGLDDAKGYLCGGFQEWLNAGYDTEFLGLLVPDALAGLLSDGKIAVLDVRSDAEWENGHIEGATHIFLGELEKRFGEIPRGKPVACICSTGLRAGVAASILRRAGIMEVYNVLGGITAWKAKDYPLTSEKLREK
jgi:hydroxyacylglutathione hydrolase